MTGGKGEEAFLLLDSPLFSSIGKFMCVCVLTLVFFLQMRAHAFSLSTFSGEGGFNKNVKKVCLFHQSFAWCGRVDANLT